MTEQKTLLAEIILKDKLYLVGCIAEEEFGFDAIEYSDGCTLQTFKNAIDIAHPINSPEEMPMSEMCTGGMIVKGEMLLAAERVRQALIINCSDHDFEVITKTLHIIASSTAVGHVID